MHVGAGAAFRAEALDVEFTEFSDEVVGALNVLQLAAFALQPRADRSLQNTNVPTPKVAQEGRALMHLPQRKWRHSKRPSTTKAFCSLNSCVMDLFPLASWNRGVQRLLLSYSPSFSNLPGVLPLSVPGPGTRVLHLSGRGALSGAASSARPSSCWRHCSLHRGGGVAAAASL